MDISLEVRKEIFRIAQRCDLDDLDTLSFIKALGNSAGIFVTIELNTPVVKRFVEVVQVFIQKAARRRLQSKDTHKTGLKKFGR